MFRSLAFAAIFVLSLGSVAMADQQGMGPCREEVNKICPNMKPGEGLGKCIKEKMSQLSPECQVKMEEKKGEMKEKYHDFSKACKADIKKLCKGVKKGEGRILECLNSHSAELSASCKEEMDQH